MRWNNVKLTGNCARQYSMANAADRPAIIARDLFAWPGGYELVGLTTDGAIMCADCIRANYRLVYAATISNDRSGWGICGVGAVGCNIEATEGDDLTCCNCNRTIDTFND